MRLNSINISLVTGFMVGFDYIDSREDDFKEAGPMPEEMENSVFIHIMLGILAIQIHLDAPVK